MVEDDNLTVTIRDINLICQHFKTYALIEGEKRRRKISKARRRKGVLEVRTASRDEWIGNVESIEWVNVKGISFSICLKIFGKSFLPLGCIEKTTL